MNDQDSVLELLFTAVGMPIFVLNIWAWFEPDLIETMFFGKKNKIEYVFDKYV
jgi:hypothetical protein